MLHTKFVHYFPSENMEQLEQNVCIRNYFQADITKVILLGANEAQLTGNYDDNLKGEFSRVIRRGFPSSNNGPQMCSMLTVS